MRRHPACLPVDKPPLYALDDLQFAIHIGFDRFGGEVGLGAARILGEAAELFLEIGRHPDRHRRAGSHVAFLFADRTQCNTSGCACQQGIYIRLVEAGIFGLPIGQSPAFAA